MIRLTLLPWFVLATACASVAPSVASEVPAPVGLATAPRSQVPAVPPPSNEAEAVSAAGQSALLRRLALSAPAVGWQPVAISQKRRLEVRIEAAPEGLWVVSQATVTRRTLLRSDPGATPQAPSRPDPAPRPTLRAPALVLAAGPRVRDAEALLRRRADVEARSLPSLRVASDRTTVPRRTPWP